MSLFNLNNNASLTGKTFKNGIYNLELTRNPSLKQHMQANTENYRMPQRPT